MRRRQEERGKEETESQVAGGGREADERKWNGSGKDRERKHKVSTGGTAAGANQGRVKGNQQ